MTERIATGCVGLDEILDGGIPANTITVVMGAPGTGKTILAEEIAFCNGTEEHPALYLTTLSEPLEKFIFHGQSYTFFDQEKVGRSVIYEDLGMLVREEGIEKLPEIVTDLLVRHKPKFLFIDSFKSLNELLPSTPDRRTVIYDLASVLTAYEASSFLIVSWIRLSSFADLSTTSARSFSSSLGRIAK